MSLFWKECRKVASSLTWLIYTVVFVGFLVSQFGEVSKRSEPVPGNRSYGEKSSGDPALIMPEAIENLFAEYSANTYTAYPLGFYKNVRLKSADQNKIAGILAKLTGQTAEEVKKAAGDESVTNTVTAGDGISFTYGGEGGEMMQNPDGSFRLNVPDKSENANKTGETESAFSLNPADSLSYEQFLELMEEADGIIGGGSSYNDLYIEGFGKIPVTYEEAMESYNRIKETDLFTGAYARLFADYATIMAAILPVFVAVSFSLKDRRNRSLGLIYTRSASSFQIIAARYAAQVTMLFLPVLLYAIEEGIRIGSWYPGEKTNPFAFVAYSFGWVLPTILFSTSVGTALTELTNSPLAIAVQGIWWFLGTSASMYRMGGGYAWDLSPRHNRLGNTDVFLLNFGQLVINRLVYTAAALALFAFTVYVFDKKRRGELHGIGIFQKIRRHSRQEP